QIERRRGDHHLGRKHAHLRVVRSQRGGGRRGALNENQLHLVAVFLEQLGFLGHPERGELAHFAGPDHVDVGGGGGRGLGKNQNRGQAQQETLDSHSNLL